MEENEIKKVSPYSLLTGVRRAVPIVLYALALFSALCFVVKDIGIAGRGIASLFLGSFSIGGYFIPAFLAIHAFFYPSDVQKKRTVSRVIFTLLTLITISALTHTITYFKADIPFAPREFYNSGKKCVGGGFVGGAVSYALTSLFGTVGLIIISAVVFALYVTYFIPSGKAAICRILAKLLGGISNLFTKINTDKKYSKVKKREKNEKKRISARKEIQESLFEDEFFASDNGLKTLTIKELGISETKNQRSLEENPHLSERVRKNEKDLFVNTDSSTNPNYSTPNSQSNLFSSVSDASYEPSDNDIIYENEPEATSSEESADSFFTEEFEPFDLKLNQELTRRPSTKSGNINESSGIREFTERINLNSQRETFSQTSPNHEPGARERRYANTARAAEFTPKADYDEAEAELQRIRAEKEKCDREYYEYSSGEEKFGEPYIPDYMKASAKETTAPDREEIEEGEDHSYSNFESAMSDYEKKITERVYTPTEDLPFDNEELGVSRSILTNDSDSQTSEDYRYLSTDGEDEEEEEEEEFDRTSLDFDVRDEESFEDTREIPEEEQNENVKAMRKMFPILDEDEESDAEEEVIEQTPEKAKEPAPERNSKFNSIFQKSAPEQKPNPEPVEEPFYEKPDYSDYQFPPLDLLIKGKSEEDLNQEEEKNANAEALVKALEQFNIRVSIKGIDRGPRITRYEIVPALGVKVQSVIARFDDISLWLGAEGIRMEAPIPGKSAIGVEIPNKKPSMVLLRDLVESEEFRRADSKTMSCLGKDVTGNPVFADISSMPHVLVAGATGMGKSVCINSILISILYKARPEEVKFIMIDPKKVEFNGYNGIPHLLIPVVTDVKQAAGALMWAVEQMEKRYDLMEKHEVKKIDAYNEKMREFPELGEPLPKIIIVIDELNDIMLQVRKPAEDLIMSIAQKARAAGIHLIIGTQRPSVDVITGVIKANIPSRISCKVASYTDSKTILEQAGAERLLNNGDMLYLHPKAQKALRVQGAFVSDNEVVNIMKFLKTQAKGNIYDPKALEEINKAAQKCSKGKGDGYDDGDDDGEDTVGALNDQQFLDAVDLAVKSGKIATSLIQRKIGVGYGKAAKFIDTMEELGIVSEPNGQRPRDVLITRDEWHEMLSRRSLD